MNKSADAVRKAVREEIQIVPYDPSWPESFKREADRLRGYLPRGVIRRIEHFGSTAVPGLAAKPIIDILVEVSALRVARNEIAPMLQKRRYDYFWRPTFGYDIPPWYAFFIKRNKRGVRTHHIHMITRHRTFTEHWERLLFRDYLIANPETAHEYELLKIELAKLHSMDRAAYTAAKAEFIERIMVQAKERQ